ncbi:MAG TPA: AI-2E family transporter [Massilibacterium sp.]|nr:AI-2E family transporter [Massilibacterium sp.]
MRNRTPAFYLFFIFLVFILYRLAEKSDFLFEKLASFSTIITPFLIAFFIAYLLKPLINLLEAKLSIKRAMSITIVYVIVIGFLVINVMFIGPRLVNSTTTLLMNTPRYVSEMNQWITESIIQNEKFQNSEFIPYIEDYSKEWIQKATTFVDFVLNKMISGVVTITSALFNFILGLIIAIYMLFDKEKFAMGSTKMIQAFFKKSMADYLLVFFKRLDAVFSKFLVGKIIDSTIIGILCFIGLLILDIPYALLISMIVGITNMIPYFGPFIGMVPAIIITLFHSPIDALWVGIFIFLLQQFDGYYLGPKILGDKVGLSPFWVILAIVIGGATFGVLGMFIATPVFAVIKEAFDTYIEKRLEYKEAEE